MPFLATSQPLSISRLPWRHVLPSPHLVRGRYHAGHGLLAPHPQRVPRRGRCGAPERQRARCAGPSGGVVGRRRDPSTSRRAEPEGDHQGQRARPRVGRQADRRTATVDHRARSGPADRRAARRQHVRRPLPGREGLDVGRDRADGSRGRSWLRQDRALLHLLGLDQARRRSRHPGQCLAHERGPHEGTPGPDAAEWTPHEQRPTRRLPPPARRQRVPRRRHRRCGDRHQPAGPALPRRQDPPARPEERRTLEGQPLPEGRRPRQALRAHLRPPQRPGTRPAQGRQPVVGRARPRRRRRGQQAGAGRQLRLEPGARLQRVRPDDRPGSAGQADRGALLHRQPDPGHLGLHVRLRQEVGPLQRGPRGRGPQGRAGGAREASTRPAGTPASSRRRP